MVHIDINSLKHLGLNYLGGLAGLEGACFAAGCSITKEYCDKVYGKHWCWLDLAFDALGIGLGLLTHYLIFKRI